VQARPEGVDDETLIDVLVDGWDVSVTSVEYAPLGFGSYHWVATDDEQQRYFVTVDDLAQKSWLGDTCDDVYVELRRAFDTAVALRDRGKLRFALAPMQTQDGATVRRIDTCRSVALFPFVSGDAGEFDGDTTPERRGDVVRMLAELHQATPSALPVARTSELDFAGRAGLTAALNDLGRPWRSGPFADRSRAWLADHARHIDQLVDDLDKLAGEVVALDRPHVITHGEPHPGNVLRAADRLMLIDWDTVALAPPERDLWLVATPTGTETALYAELTGHAVSAAALSLYRLAWQLADIAAFTSVFRSAHEQTVDTEAAWRNLEGAIDVGAR
jgi:spectinomycin phosphotransferase